LLPILFITQFLATCLASPYCQFSEAPLVTHWEIRKILLTGTLTIGSAPVSNNWELNRVGETQTPRQPENQSIMGLAS